ncbi:MAG: hypothetical protein NTAFB09_04550 [Nitrosospira sp.]
MSPGWLIKAKQYGQYSKAAFAFVTTNSICQGIQVPELWPSLLDQEFRITFAYTSFKWNNLASNKAGVTVVIVGMSNNHAGMSKLFSSDQAGENLIREVENINAYLVPSSNIFVQKKSKRTDDLANMDFGNKAVDGGHLYVDRDDLGKVEVELRRGWVRKIFGATELIKGIPRFCLWIPDDAVGDAARNPFISSRLDRVREMRSASKKLPTQRGADEPHKFEERRQRGDEQIIALPRITSENRDYLPVSVLSAGVIIYLVGLTDVAEIVGMSRQNMRKLMLAHADNFPAPVHEGSTSIWHLADVLAWLQAKGNYSLTQTTMEVARVALMVNVAKEGRRLSRPVLEELETLVG